MIPVKSKFSHLGFSIIFYLIAGNIIGAVLTFILTLGQIITLFFEGLLAPHMLAGANAYYAISNMINTDSFIYTLVNSLGSYLFATPLTLYVLNIPRFRDVPLKGLSFFTPYEKSMKRNLSFKEFLGFFTVTVSFGVIGSLVAAVVSGLLSALFGFQMNDILTMMIDKMSLPEMFLMTVILAPIFEELLYRYGLVGYCRRYGEWNAIFVSGIVFGLIHTNLYQFFYAFLLGCVFAYVFLYTRQIKYTIALHVLFNFFGAFVPMWLTPDGTITTAYTIFALLQYIVAIIGIAVFVIYVKRRKLFPTNPNAPIPGKFSLDSILNPGMICLFIVCVIFTVVFQMSLMKML